MLASSPHFASAYVAAGDRTFPSRILLPQVAPADQLYVTPTTQPVSEGHSTDLAVNFAKTLTERLGVRFEEDYTWLGRKLAEPGDDHAISRDSRPAARSVGHAQRRSRVGRHRHAAGSGLA